MSTATITAVALAVVNVLLTGVNVALFINWRRGHR